MKTFPTDVVVDAAVRNLLDEEAARINVPSFISRDPVQFPRRFSKQEDIEIVSFLAAAIAWGNRKMICRDVEKLLAMMENDPYNFVKEKGYESLDPALNIHRTFFVRDLQFYLRGLRRVFADNGTMDAFSKYAGCLSAEAPAWHFAEKLRLVLDEENNGLTNSRCLPVNLAQTALKRVNMALRWLVRDDGIVDMGVWKSIPKSKLFIPLDVHVGNTSRKLGLLHRKANDRKSVEALTAVLRSLNPEDPCIYDFALFGIGIGD